MGSRGGCCGSDRKNRKFVESKGTHAGKKEGRRILGKWKATSASVGIKKGNKGKEGFGIGGEL